MKASFSRPHKATTFRWYVVYLRDFLDQLEKDIRVQNDDSLRTQTLQSIEVLLTNLKNMPKLCFVLLKTPAVQPILRAFKTELIQNNIQGFNKLQTTQDFNTLPIDLVFYNGITALFGLIEWWFDNDFNPSVDTMLTYYEQLIMYPKWELLVGKEMMMDLLGVSP